MRPAALLTRLLLCLLPVGLSAATPFEAGLAAYEAEAYDEAAAAFEAALAAGETPALRHNAALAAFRLGKPAEALWHLERALRLAPLDPAYREKRALLRAQLGLPADPPPWYTLGAAALGLNAWLCIAALTGWSWLALLLLPRCAGRRPAPGLRILRALSLPVCCVALGATALQHIDRDRAIALGETAHALRAAPAAAAPVTGRVQPGAHLQISETFRDYFKVRSKAGADGWLHREALRPLYPERYSTRPLAKAFHLEGGGTYAPFGVTSLGVSRARTGRF